MLEQLVENSVVHKILCMYNTGPSLKSVLYLTA